MLDLSYAKTIIYQDQEEYLQFGRRGVANVQGGDGIARQVTMSYRNKILTVNTEGEFELTADKS